MQIRDLFATAVTERIEPVVKVLDRKPAVVLAELGSLVVTPQWERFLHRALDAYSDAADREDEGSIGIWISGFFGSGKSLLMKTLGALLEGGAIEHRRVHEVFLNRMPNASEEKADIQRFLAICERKIATTVVGGNLHAQQAAGDEPLPLIAFKLFAQACGFSQSWPFAWAVECQIDRQDRTEAFRRRAEELASVGWREIVEDTSFYIDALYRAAADTVPEAFPDATAVARSFDTALHEGGITAESLISRLRAWCQARDGGGKRQKLLIQLDELGQWIRGGNSNERIMQVQALVETAAVSGDGRIWLAVTAHGDIQALSQNVQQEQYAKINQRFDLKAKLTNDDIGLVVEERLLRKHQAERIMLTARFRQRGGELVDMGSVAGAGRVYKAPTEEAFALFYPFLPWTVDVLPDVVRGIAQAAQRGDELTGSTRTLIGIVQGGLIETPGLLASPVGRLLPLADLYEQLASDIPLQTRTDLNSIAAKVEGATSLTSRAARALYLLGEAEHIPTTLENVARALADSLDCALQALGASVRIELERLVGAGYAKQVGETYVFLTTQQRGFQDRVRVRQSSLRESTNDLILGLKEYDSDTALRFEEVSVAGRELKLKLVIDSRVVRNPGGAVALHVSSPFQRMLDPGIGDDSVMNQRSNADPNSLYIRLGEAKGLRDALALALAAAAEAEAVIGGVRNSGPDLDVAREAKARDLPSYKAEVQRLLAHSVRGADIFFRGSRFALGVDGSANAIRATLAQAALVPTIYSRFAEVPHRIANEEAAVKAALAGNAANADLQALGLFRADGSINEAHPLLSTLRGQLPLAEKDLPPKPAEDLRKIIEQPPYGWDGNAAKIGLALLLRLSVCRLIDNGKYLTDPAGAEAQQALAKEARFKSLRVQGVQGEMEIGALKEVRDQLEALFGIKPVLVAATLHNDLGAALSQLSARAGTLLSWALTAQCPLPTAFQAGRDLAEELANVTAPVQRLAQFRDQGESLRRYVVMLGTLEAFKNTHGKKFTELRDFYTGMVNAGLEIPTLRDFVRNWRTLYGAATITEPARWQEIEGSHALAAQALLEQAAAWRQQAEVDLAAVEADLPRQVREADVPEELIEVEVQQLFSRLGEVHRRLETQPFTAIAARGALTALQSARLQLPVALRELKQRHMPPAESEETRITWHELLGDARIAGGDDLEALIGRLRRQVEPLLDVNKVIVVE